MPDLKLETCPFCGKSAEVYNNGAHLDLGASYSDLPGIGCPNCHFAITRKTVRDALIIWNRRANNIEKKLTSTNTKSF